MIHQEGVAIILTSLLFSTVLLFGVLYILPYAWLKILFLLLLAIFNFLVIWFFRNPKRDILKPDSKLVRAPADGKLVVIEEVIEEEFYKDKRRKLSIFMSPLNVHVNRYPIDGKVDYVEYHPGEYLVAWHPKSSERNERSSIVLTNDSGTLLLRQIAGAVARRIVTYSKKGDRVNQGEDLGFIKFGSRVDVFLPLNAEIKVNVGDVIVGNKTILASW